MSDSLGVMSLTFVCASASADFGAHESSMPTANGTHSTGSVQLSRVTTPSGVRTPDWMLDCEICQKSGLNLVSHPFFLHPLNPAWFS